MGWGSQEEELGKQVLGCRRWDLGEGDAGTQVPSFSGSTAKAAARSEVQAGQT
jgi:hypothetical protein